MARFSIYKYPAATDRGALTAEDRVKNIAPQFIYPHKKTGHSV
jgi:hypothetical protein